MYFNIPFRLANPCYRSPSIDDTFPVRYTLPEVGARRGGPEGRKEPIGTYRRIARRGPSPSAEGSLNLFLSLPSHLVRFFALFALLLIRVLPLFTRSSGTINSTVLSTNSREQYLLNKSPDNPSYFARTSFGNFSECVIFQNIAQPLEIPVFN